MPQLNLAWWLFNFIIGWIFILIVFSILLNKNITSLKASIHPSNLTFSFNNNWLWI